MATTETTASEADLEAPTIDWRTKIGPDPNRPGPDRWRLIEEGRPVWAIIGNLRNLGAFREDGTPPTAAAIAETAADYNISEEAVRASIAHYLDHKCAIDTLLAINRA